MITRPKVLIVDDSFTSRLSLEATLGSDYEVHVAVNGETGVARALAVRPDVILLDVMMPVMDGYEACRALRAHEETATTPIILVTSRDHEHDVEEGYVNGATDYVLKPADRLELLSKVETWLAASRPWAVGA